MIEKIKIFININEITDVIFAIDNQLFNNTNEYPESYFLFEEEKGVNYVYRILRDNKKLIYKDIDRNNALAIFLIKVFLIKYSKINKDKVNISTDNNIIFKNLTVFYKNYLYHQAKTLEEGKEETLRLQKRVNNIKIMLDEFIRLEIIESIPDIEIILEVLKS